MFLTESSSLFSRRASIRIQGCLNSQSTEDLSSRTSPLFIPSLVSPINVFANGGKQNNNSAYESVIGNQGVNTDYQHCRQGDLETQ